VIHTHPTDSNDARRALADVYALLRKWGAEREAADEFQSSAAECPGGTKCNHEPARTPPILPHCPNG
jgi:hypothetical protein